MAARGNERLSENGRSWRQLVLSYRRRGWVKQSIGQGDCISKNGAFGVLIKPYTITPYVEFFSGKIFGQIVGQNGAVVGASRGSSGSNTARCKICRRPPSKAIALSENRGKIKSTSGLGVLLLDGAVQWRNIAL